MVRVEGVGQFKISNGGNPLPLGTLNFEGLEKDQRKSFDPSIQNGGLKRLAVLQNNKLSEVIYYYLYSIRIQVFKKVHNINKKKKNINHATRCCLFCMV